MHECFQEALTVGHMRARIAWTNVAEVTMEESRYMQNIFKRWSIVFYTALNSGKFFLALSPILLLCFFQLLALGTIQRKFNSIPTSLQNKITTLFSFLLVTVPGSLSSGYILLKSIKGQSSQIKLLFLSLIGFYIHQQQVTETQHKWIKHKNVHGSHDPEDQKSVWCRVVVDACMVLLGLYLSPFLASDFLCVYSFSGRLFLCGVHLVTRNHYLCGKRIPFSCWLQQKDQN